MGKIIFCDIDRIEFFESIVKENDDMANQPSNKNQKGKYQQGSGTQYHKEHASHVPDYGANIVDPNVNSLNNNNSPSE